MCIYIYIYFLIPNLKSCHNGTGYMRTRKEVYIYIYISNNCINNILHFLSFLEEEKNARLPCISYTILCVLFILVL